MTREEFRKEMTAIMPRYYELVDVLRNGGSEKFAPLNKYFCRGASYPFGVSGFNCITREDGYFHFSISYSILNSRFEVIHGILFETDNIRYCNERGFNPHGLCMEQMSAIVEWVKAENEDMENRLAALYERGSKEQPIDELEKECEQVANEILAGKTNKYGNKLRATLTIGKRGCDTNTKPYSALIVEYYGNVFGKVDWHYLAGFRFHKDRFGINRMVFFRPLCGECDMEFNMGTFKEYVMSFTKEND